MGKYINKNSKGELLPTSYVQRLVALRLDGAIELDAKDVKFQPNLICVVDNGELSACAYVYDIIEYKRYISALDTRRKTWLIYEHAEKLAVY